MSQLEGKQRYGRRHGPRDDSRSKSARHERARARVEQQKPQAIFFCLNSGREIGTNQSTG